MRSPIVAVVMLVSMGAASAADLYDSIYVSDLKLCDEVKAGGDVHDLLYSLRARAVAPKVGVWMGESGCTFVNQTSVQGSLSDNDAKDVDLYATARCLGAELDFLDQVVITGDSIGINLDNGDTGQAPPAKVQIISTREGAPGYVADADSYAGIYTRCDALSLKDLQDVQ